MVFITLWLLISVEKISALFQSFDVLIYGGFMGFVAIAFGCVLLADNTDEFKDYWNKGVKYRKYAFAAIIVGIISTSFGQIMPTQKEMAIIVGGGTAYNVLTSDQAKQVGGKAIQALNMKLDEILAEDVNNKKESVIVESIEEEPTKNKE